MLLHATTVAKEIHLVYLLLVVRLEFLPLRDKLSLQLFFLPYVPMIHVATKWTHAFNQDRVLVQLSLQKMSRQGVRTHPPMVLSAMSREIKQLAFF